MVNVTETCRDKKELNVLCSTLLELSFKDINKKGINPLLVETYRSQERQNYLYSQGRTTSGNKITWTLNSIHTLRNAVDVVPQRIVSEKMAAIWNSKDKETLEIINSMTKFGFEAGANWSSSPDSPHFQIKGVSITEKEYHKKNTNAFITKMIQNALNKYLGSDLKIKLKIDGDWGLKTDKAINLFRVKNKWSSNGKLGSIALNELLKSY